jgi:hypothetical protein
MTAPMCESATETPIRSRMPACGVGTDRIQRAVGNPQAVREDQRRGGPVPAGLKADCRGYHHLYRDGAALTARHDLGLAHDMAVLGMTWIPECLDSLVIQDDEVRHAAGSARASAHNSTSSGLASGWFAAISTAAWRSRPGCPPADGRQVLGARNSGCGAALDVPASPSLSNSLETQE